MISYLAVTANNRLRLAVSYLSGIAERAGTADGGVTPQRSPGPTGPPTR